MTITIVIKNKYDVVPISCRYYTLIDSKRKGNNSVILINKQKKIKNKKRYERKRFKNKRQRKTN